MSASFSLHRCTLLIPIFAGEIESRFDAVIKRSKFYFTNEFEAVQIVGSRLSAQACSFLLFGSGRHFNSAVNQPPIELREAADEIPCTGHLIGLDCGWASCGDLAVTAAVSAERLQSDCVGGRSLIWSGSSLEKKIMPQFAVEEAIEPVRYATRLPILAANQKVIGYKLLFRTSIQSYLTGDGSGGTNRTAIDVSSLIGLTTLCDNRLAFISCGREILLGNHLLLLPPEKLVAEIEKTVQPDDDVRQACGRLKQAGYKIALGSFTLDDPRAPLVAFADFLKVDIQSASRDDVENIVVRYRGRDCRMLAENVETREDFELAKEAGFRYFQGYFFRRPEKVRARGVSSNLAICLQLLKAVSKPRMDWQEVEEIIKRDAALYYRLLRYLNSAALGLRGQVRSVRQALTILGEDHFRRWCRLALIFDMSQDQPSDLMLSALVRARFGELIGEKIEHGDSDLFLLGLLSLMDAILEIPMGTVLEDLPLDPESKTLLLEQTGRLAPIYALVFGVEAGSWWDVVRSCKQLGLEEQFVADAYRAALEWAQKTATNA